MVEPLFILALAPGKRQQLPPLDYSGSLLLRWQILLTSAGIDPIELSAQISAQQTIDGLGFLERGEWAIPGGDRLRSPLTEISYSPLLDWFITTPAGFKSSQILFYQYDQPVYQIPNQNTSMNISFPSVPASTSTGGTPSVVSPSITSFALLAANTSRLDGLIKNNTNRDLWVLFGSGAATLNHPSMLVPKQGNVSMPEGYVGAVSGICSGVAASLVGQVEITEFNAQ
jgi:hypothetical protein